MSASGATPRVPLPLSGQRVLVTRPDEQSQDLRDRLAAQGAEVLVQPGILVGGPPDWAPVDAALDRLDRIDWLVFSSSNGVRALVERFLARGGNVQRLLGIRLAAIGPGTAAELTRYGLRAEVVPAEYRAESLAAALAPSAPGRRFLLARANRGRPVLPDQLMEAGGIVEQVVVYSTFDVERPEPEVAAALAAGRIDWVTVTSSAIARAVVKLFGADLWRSRLASISPITSEVLCEMGFPPSAQAKQYDMAGLVEAIVAARCR